MCLLAPSLARRRKNNHVVTTKNFKNFISSGARVRVTGRADGDLDRGLAPLPRSRRGGRDPAPGSRRRAGPSRALLSDRARLPPPPVAGLCGGAFFNRNPRPPPGHLFFSYTSHPHSSTGIL